MGLNESKHQSKTYLNIVGGKLARRYKEHHEVNGKTVTIDREIKDRSTGEVTKVVIERHYQDIDGLIIGASIDTKGDFGSRLVLELMDGDTSEQFIIQIPLESSYGRAIMMRVPNVDTEKLATIRPYSFEEKDSGKTQTGVVIYQKDCDWEDDKVPYKWNKENPGNMPQWEFTEVAGKKKWNSDKQTNFLCDSFLAWADKIGEINTHNSDEANDPDIMDMEREFALEQEKKVEAKQPPQNDSDEIDELLF